MRKSGWVNMSTTKIIFITKKEGNHKILRNNYKYAKKKTLPIHPSFSNWDFSPAWQLFCFTSTPFLIYGSIYSKLYPLSLALFHFIFPFPCLNILLPISQINQKLQARNFLCFLCLFPMLSKAKSPIYVLLLLLSRFSRVRLCDPIDGSPPGCPVPGILQARTLEWVAISFSNAWKWKVKVKSLSRVRRFATPWTAAQQAPPSMGFSRQEYWSGVPSPSPIYVLGPLWFQRLLKTSGINPMNIFNYPETIPSWYSFHFFILSSFLVSILCFSVVTHPLSSGASQDTTTVTF